MLRPPAAADDAAIQTELPKAAPPKRRCFQFRLRTLMIGVTLLAISAAGWSHLFRSNEGRPLSTDIALDFASFVAAMTLILILAWCVYGSLLVAAIYFTQATTRRVLGALAGGCAVALIGAGVEGLAHARGWWRYTSGDTPVGPLAMYPLLVVAFAFLALIGWRVMRRFGLRGLTVFLAILAVIGTLRDYFIAGSLMGLVVFAPGIALAIIDALLWAGLTALAITVMRAVSGPSRDDRLARRRGHPV